jgi:hypothetical protein
VREKGYFCFREGLRGREREGYAESGVRNIYRERLRMEGG